MKSSAARSRAGNPAPRVAGGARASRAPRSFDPLQILERGRFPATLYLEGPSEPLKAALLAELKAAWAAECPESPLPHVFRAAESSVEEILAAFQGTSLFSPRELSLVLEIEDLGRSEKRIAALAKGIAQPNGGSCLILVESAAETPRKALEPLRAACETRFVAFPPRRNELLQWGRRRLTRAGLEFEAGVVEAIVDGCEGDALAFFGELEKLCSWGEGERRPLSRDDVATLLRPVVGADLSGYLAAVASGEPQNATRRLGRVLAAGVGEGTVLFALSNLVSGALGGWARYRELSLVLTRRSSPRALGHALDALYRAEAAWKGGRADVVAVLEEVTRALCRKAAMLQAR